jgi:carbon-monoxide dehydrogenase medium subunit
VPLPHFEYVAARTVEEALDLWRERPACAYFAGGTDLLPQMRLGRRAPATIIDIKRVSGLDRIRETEAGLLIGAAVPLAEIETHPIIRTDFPLLAECARVVGARPVRNRATLVGNICNASPAADTAVALLVLDGMVRTVGVDGARELPVNEFFTGPGRTVLRLGELVTEVVLPRAAVWRGSYLRLSRRRGMDLATVGVLVARSNRAAGSLHRIALCAVAPVPLRVPAAETLLDADGAGGAGWAGGAGGTRWAATIGRAAEIARASCSPITDMRGTAEYRRDMVGVLVARGAAALARVRAEAPA